MRHLEGVIGRFPRGWSVGHGGLAARVVTALVFVSCWCAMAQAREASGGVVESEPLGDWPPGCGQGGTTGFARATALLFPERWSGADSALPRSAASTVPQPGGSRNERTRNGVDDAFGYIGCCTDMSRVELPGSKVPVLCERPILADLVCIDEVARGNGPCQFSPGVVNRQAVGTFTSAHSESVCRHVPNHGLADGVVACGHGEGCVALSKLARRRDMSSGVVDAFVSRSHVGLDAFYPAGRDRFSEPVRRHARLLA